MFFTWPQARTPWPQARKLHRRNANRGYHEVDRTPTPTSTADETDETQTEVTSKLTEHQRPEPFFSVELRPR